jgi:hypothetical protein
MPVNHDVAWTLWLAQQVMAGRVLYEDLIEINPPLIIWLNLPVVWLAQLLGVSTYVVYYTALLLVLVASAALALRLLPVRHAGAGVVLAFVLGPLTGADLGQREHICVALLLPLLALALRRRMAPGAPPSLGAAVAAGALAGVAIALKPFLAPIWLLLVPYRRPAVEDLTVVIIGVLYVACVLLLAPAYIPLSRSLMETYVAFNQQRWSAMLTHPAAVTLLVVAAGWVYLLLQGRRSQMVTVCLIAAGGAWVGALVQRKGWSYHWYPAAAFTVLAVMAIYRAATTGTSPDRSDRSVPPRRVASYLLAAMSLVVIYRFVGSVEAFRARQSSIELIRSVARPGDRVLMLSSRVSDAWPAVPLAGATWAARLPALWFAQANGVRPPLMMERGERLLYATLVEDLLAEPERLVVETSELNAFRRGPPGLDALAYLRQDARAAAALAHYRETQRINGMSIWVRQ